MAKELSWDLDNSDPGKDLQEVTDSMLNKTGIEPIPHLTDDTIHVQTEEEVIKLSEENGWQVKHFSYMKYYEAVWGINEDQEIKVIWSKDKR